MSLILNWDQEQGCVGHLTKKCLSLKKPHPQNN